MSAPESLLTRLMTPVSPPYDPIAWNEQPLPERLRMVCRAWALQGYGTPPAVFIVYALKVVLYVAGWVAACTVTSPNRVADIASWWLTPIAFQKAIVWSMLFEITGLGCGSGPLTGRYHPPLGGVLYFFRPGTTKLALFPKLPVIGGTTRSWFDVVLFAALYAALIRALFSTTHDLMAFAPIAILVPVVAISDKTTFLAARSEHYWVTIVCFLFASQWIAGAKVVQLALWFWAGVSKLNHHFPAVVCVMTSNSPILRWKSLRKKMYRAYPDDLRPSALAVTMAHVGTFLELTVPLVLITGSGGWHTTIGILMMLMLHGFITSNVPMGVPIEWNVMVVYGSFFLFGEHASVGLDIWSAPLIALLAVFSVLIPLAGNFFPDRISFLLAMRYYAGNWAYSVWLFDGEAHKKLERLTASSAWVYDQLDRFYDRPTAVGLVGKVLAFRAMHLHGRALQLLVPKAVPSIVGRHWVDGEIVAGMVLGWNFGDGHLHQDQLLSAVQEQCNFEPGEVRCVFVESQPLFGTKMPYRIADAATGISERGELDVAELRTLQPWPSTAAESPQ